MSSFLSRVQRGRRSNPPRIVVHGTPGIGKSTFAAAAPRPIFIQTEDGLDEIDCTRFPMAVSFSEVVSSLRELVSEEHDFETVVIDSLDWLERLIHDDVCAEYGVKNIEKADGGYTRGYKHALDRWREIIQHLDHLRNRRGMIVILLAHSKVERFEDPEASPYDRYVPRLHKHAIDLVSEWADAVLFATRKIRTKTEDAGFNRKRTTAAAVGKDGGDRILRCVGGPACMAKNRYGINEELPLSWVEFMGSLSGKLSGNPTEAN